MTNHAAAQPLDLEQIERDIMNIPCRRSDDSFADIASRVLYKEGHRDARHDAADLIAHARAAQPESATGTTGARVPTWRERLLDGVRFCPSVTEMVPAMESELADLRAQLAARGQESIDRQLTGAPRSTASTAMALACGYSPDIGSTRFMGEETRLAWLSPCDCQSYIRPAGQ